MIHLKMVEIEKVSFLNEKQKDSCVTSVVFIHSLAPPPYNAVDLCSQKIRV